MTSALNAASLGTGSPPVQNCRNRATQAQTQPHSNSDDKYVFFSRDPVYNNQLELFMQQIAFFENSPNIGKGVKGSLFRHSQFWEYIGANQFILNTIKNGYVVPFVTTPPPMKFKNNKSAITNELFVDKSISDLLESGCVQEVPFQPFVISPLSVAENKASGKKRLFLDLSELNHYVQKRKVKFEDWNVAKHFFQKDCFLFKFDLKFGYHHLDICKKTAYIFFLQLEGRVLLL